MESCLQNGSSDHLISINSIQERIKKKGCLVASQSLSKGFVAARFSDDFIQYLVLTFLNVEEIQNLGQINSEWATKTHFEKRRNKWTNDSSTLILAAQIRQIISPPKFGSVFKLQDYKKLKNIEQLFSVSIFPCSRISHLQISLGQGFRIMHLLQEMPCLKLLMSCRLGNNDALELNSRTIERLHIDDAYFLTDTGLGYLQNLTRLKFLSISFGHWITGIGLSYLSHLKSLTELDISHCERITDTCLSNLIHIPKLKKFSISSSQITDAGLLNLSQNPPKKLKTLTIYAQSITDGGLLNLCHLTALTSLSIRADITDEGILHLCHLTNLEFLGLTCTRITEASLTHLITRLNKLRSVCLLGCSQITNEMDDKLLALLDERNKNSPEPMSESEEE